MAHTGKAEKRLVTKECADELAEASNHFALLLTRKLKTRTRKTGVCGT